MSPALPAPECPLGYTDRQLREILGAQLPGFDAWFDGQTGAVCEGREWNPETGEYQPTTCAGAPHGLVVYAHDLERFLRTRRRPR